MAKAKTIDARAFASHARARRPARRRHGAHETRAAGDGRAANLLEFKQRILFWGYGAVAQCTLPILVRHLRAPYANITVMDFEDRRAVLAPWLKRGVKFVRRQVTRENLGALLGRHLGRGDLLIDLAWNIDCWRSSTGVTTGASSTSTRRLSFGTRTKTLTGRRRKSGPSTGAT